MNEADGVEILLFWAGVFFTCVVGIIELFPELDKWSSYNGSFRIFHKLWVAILYFILVVGMVSSFDRFLNLYMLRYAGSPIMDKAVDILGFEGTRTLGIFIIIIVFVPPLLLFIVKLIKEWHSKT